MKIRLIFSILLFITLNVLIVSFPDSGNPFVVVPDITTTSDVVTSCTFSILSGSCSSWSEVPNQLLEIPEECSDSLWSKVILTFTAQEQGVQYDRFGAIWIGDIEVVRTTTPEPTDSGITWTFDRDISVYSEYIRSTKNISTYISIPNNVDSTYTGIIQVELTLTVYLATDEELSSGSFEDPPYVLPLTSAPSSSSFPWNVMQVSGSESLSYEVTLSEYATEAYVELYASAHGCEEFYYSNVPSDSSEETGICGGGSYRELQVYIDGYLAVAAFPFPTIYSGGINPFLWRPVGGIMSFSVAPRRLDITPYLHLLNDGLSHNISVTVFGNNPQSGYWYLDASLLLYNHESSNEKSAISSDLYVYDSSPQVQETTSISRSLSISFDTVGYHYFQTSRVLTYSDGSTSSRTVDGKLVMHNTNEVKGITTEVTNQRTLSEITSKSTSADGVVSKLTTIDDFPLYVYDYYSEDLTTMDLEAHVNYTYHRHKRYVTSPSTKSSEKILSSDYMTRSNPVIVLPDKGLDNTDSDNEIEVFSISWNDGIAAAAAYNRSLDHTLVYVEDGISLEKFTVSSASDDNCFDSVTAADNGFAIKNDVISNDCSLPSDLNLCEYDLCGNIALTSFELIKPMKSFTSSVSKLSGVFASSNTIESIKELLSIDSSDHLSLNRKESLRQPRSESSQLTIRNSRSVYKAESLRN